MTAGEMVASHESRVASQGKPNLTAEAQRRGGVEESSRESTFRLIFAYNSCYQGNTDSLSQETACPSGVPTDPGFGLVGWPTAQAALGSDI